MQTQSFHTQTPLFQGFLLPKRKHKEEHWLSSRTEVPVFVAETPSQMMDKWVEGHANQLKANTLAFEEIPHLTLGEGDKGGEGSTKTWEPAHKGKVIRIWDGKDGATNKNWNHALDNGLDMHDNWTVICHGKPKYLEPIKGGPGIDPRMLSRILYGNGYTKGEAVTLDCCNTGFLGDFDPEGFSYKLSRLLKAPVTAPTNKVQITAKGTYLVNHPGKMEIINNGKLE